MARGLRPGRAGLEARDAHPAPAVPEALRRREAATACGSKKRQDHDRLGRVGPPLARGGLGTLDRRRLCVRRGVFLTHLAAS